MGDGFFNRLEIIDGYISCRPIITSFQNGTASGICLHNVTNITWDNLPVTFSYVPLPTPSLGYIYMNNPGGGNFSNIVYWGDGGSVSSYGPGFWNTPESYRAAGPEGYNVYGGPFEYEVGFTFMYIQSGSDVVYQVSASSFYNPKNTSCGSYRAWYSVSGSQFSNYACHGALVTFKTGSVMNLWLEANYVYWGYVNDTGGSITVPVHPY